MKAIFYGTTEAALDAKGRSALPAEMREVFAQSEQALMRSRLYFTRRDCPGFPAHLTCFGRSLQERLMVELDRCVVDPKGDESNDVERASELEAIFKETDMVRFDTAGRFSLGESAIEWLKAENTLLFVGLGRFFEIWNPSHAAQICSTEMTTHRGIFHLSNSAGGGGDE